MTATTPVAAGRATKSRWITPLLAVVAWEVRRWRALRSTWALGAAAAGLFLFSVWVPAMAGVTYSTPQYSVTGNLAGISVIGLVVSLPGRSLLLLALLLPFVNAESVTRDLARRTHELLLTTALPAWAYVWGRYLAGLLLSLMLSVVLLLAILVAGQIEHATVTDYPSPPIA